MANIDPSFASSLEWRVWDIVHTRRLGVKAAARQLNIGMPQVWEALAKYKIVLDNLAAG